MVYSVLLAIAAAALYSVSCHIDKFLISKHVKGVDYRSLIVVSSLVAGGVMAVIYAFLCQFELAFDLRGLIALASSELVYLVACIYWFIALEREETSLVVLMLQLMPVFYLILSHLFLKGDNAAISVIQAVGCVIITLAALMVTYEPDGKKFNRKKLKTLAILTCCSAGYAFCGVITRKINETHDFNRTIFWMNAMLFLWGAAICVVFKKYRQSFMRMLRKNGKVVLGLNLVNEITNSFAEVLASYASLFAPIALVSFVEQGVQPFIVILLGVILARFFPKIEKEKLSKKAVVLRVVTAAVCFVGLACINFG